MHTLKTLNPQNVWEYFEEICKIPRPSKKEEKIIVWLENFAKNNHISVKKDAIGNLLFFKKASSGLEKVPVTVLQAHVDMVCEKNAGVIHDFEQDPINLLISGEWVKASGTTLGADNGIGIAMILAVFSDPDLIHGPLEALFTVDEETGLTGANALQPGFLSGKTLINLDSEDEGKIYIGCAGGVKTSIEYTSQWGNISSGVYYNLEISGLKGGHSGDDIEKGRGNAIKILTGLLSESMEHFTLRILNIEGGNLHNAIPREASAIVNIPEPEKNRFFQHVDMYFERIQKELGENDPEFRLHVTDYQPNNPLCLHPEMAKGMIEALHACPNGVIAMSEKIKDLVETSLNIASIKRDKNNNFQIVISQRSSNDLAIKELARKVKNLFEITGAKVEVGDGYPGWEPNLDSPILKIAQSTYESLFKRKPEVKAIHAGLECGLFLAKFPELDMISIGPTIRSPHSPDEKLEISTVDKTYQYLKEILVAMAKGK